ncbi:MAG: 2-hydroxychromene-2-carboxylate isomerase [Burkholderiaceae bacterium]|nr:2-hydroxychromene-2-carboxylate isomerase [Burkholderiaceae bacterium]
MKTLDVWFDPVSPFVYLAFERLPQALEGLSYDVRYRPVLFAGLLAHWGHKGPAEIEPKRAWTFRHCAWLADRHGLAFHTPAQHPFNPLALLRLALACCEPGGTPNRWVVEAILRHVWCGGGADANDAQRLHELAATLQPTRDPRGDDVKAELRASTDAAIARGVFGVPTIEVDGRAFWGLDALPMLAAAMRGEPWFDGPAWHAEGAPRPGVART